VTTVGYYSCLVEEFDIDLRRWKMEGGVNVSPSTCVKR